MLGLNRLLISVGMIALFGAVATAVWADEDSEPAERRRAKGERVENRLDRTGDEVDRKLDRRGKRQNHRLDEAGERAKRKAERAARQKER